MRTLWLVAAVLAVGAEAALLPHERAAAVDLSSLGASENLRDPRLFFQFISVRPDECTTTSDDNPTGICYTPTQCTNLGGTGAGNCAGGLGTCCYFTRTCGETTFGNGTSFVNPSYPSTDTTLSNCQLTVDLLSDNICQLRLDFEEFELDQPNSEGECETDFLKITGSANDNTVPTLCGTNTGKHMYVDLDPTGGNPKINIDTGATSSASREWKIDVHQIACNSPDRAPEGCTQYYTDSSGTVESFNYATPTAASLTDYSANNHLRNLQYGVCVASRSGYCSITWSNNADSDPYSFMMTGDSGSLPPDLIGTYDASTRGDACTTDYVIIPGGEFNDPNDTTMSTTLQADRFCGLGFPTQVTSSIQPFVMFVNTNDGEISDGDGANVGFSLQYRQNSC